MTRTMYEVAFEIPAIKQVGFIFVDDYNMALNWYLNYTEHIAKDLSLKEMRPNAMGKPAFMTINQFETDKPQSFFDEMNNTMDKANKEQMEFMNLYESPKFKKELKLLTVLSGMPVSQFDNLFTYTYAVVSHLNTELTQEQKDRTVADITEMLFAQRGVKVSNAEEFTAEVNTLFKIMSEHGALVVNEFAECFEATMDSIAPQGPFVMLSDGREVSVAELMRNSVPYDSEER